MSIAKAVSFGFPTKTVGTTASGATSIEVEAVDGNITPILGTGEFTYAILSSDNNFTDPEANYETVKITAIDSSDPYILTVVRNQESTTGSAQEWGDDTSIMVSLTAVGWNELRDNAIYGNWDGGKPDTNYGGFDAIDGGGV